MDHMFYIGLFRENIKNIIVFNDLTWSYEYWCVNLCSGL